MKWTLALPPQLHTGQFSTNINPLATEKSGHLIEQDWKGKDEKDFFLKKKKNPQHVQIKNVYVSFHKMYTI